MKIFVTGASGFIGFAVSSALARAGHSVVGLVHSSAKLPRLAGAEIEPLLGDMGEPAGWRERARECQVLLHCAAEYSPRHRELDRATVGELLGLHGRRGHARLVVYTSGVWIYGDTQGRRVDEDTPLSPSPFLMPRFETEQLVLQANASALRTLVVRPGCVFGGSGSLTASWFASAEQEGAARFVGEGSQRWAMVHLADLAELYVRAIESNLAGEVFNAVDASRFSVRECAEAASRAAGAGGKVVSTPIADARAAMGPMADCLTYDQHIDSGKAARLLGWTPRQRGFVDQADSLCRAWRTFRSTPASR